MEAEKLNCPLMGEIQDILCFDISMVAEELAPVKTAPKEAIEVPNFKAICLNCPNHRD